MLALKKIFDYFLGKRFEIGDLELKDAVLAKTVADIHRKRTHKEIVSVPLYSLRQVHELDRDNTQDAIAKRAELALAASGRDSPGGRSYPGNVERVFAFGVGDKGGAGKR